VMVASKDWERAPDKDSRYPSDTIGAHAFKRLTKLKVANEVLKDRRLSFNLHST